MNHSTFYSLPQILKKLSQKGWKNKNIHQKCSVDDYTGVSSLMFAVRGPEKINKQQKLILSLLKQGVDINAVDDDGCNALWYAYYFLEDVPLLVQNGIDIHCQNMNGDTLLDEYLDRLYPIIEGTEGQFAEIQQILIFLFEQNFSCKPEKLTHLTEKYGEYWAQLIECLLAQQQKQDLLKTIPLHQLDSNIKIKRI